MDVEEYLTEELKKYISFLPKNKKLQDAVNLFMYGIKKANWNNKTAILFTNKFPEKVPNTAFYLWFLRHRNVKWCRKCNEILPTVAFNKNISSFDGLQNYCVECTSQYMKRYSDRGAKQKEKIIKATPKWVNLNEISSIYRKCPENYHVDHIVPLKGANICGLHVPWNLQYLPASENIKKSNKYEGGWEMGRLE